VFREDLIKKRTKKIKVLKRGKKKTHRISYGSVIMKAAPYSPMRRGAPVPSARQGLSAAADRDGKRVVE
jgi:hypothetical protein